MAQTIKLKRSATSGAAPTTSDLALGEVAINTYDGKMYIKKSVSGTESIVEIGGVGAGSVSYLEAGMIEYEYTATSSQTTFSGSDNNSATLSYTANSIMVFLNGVLQDDGVDYTATNGTSVVFTSGLVANDEVRIVAFTNVTTTGSLQNPTKLDAITTVNAQAAYSLTLNSSAYTPSSEAALIVSLNGITQEPGDSFTISGSTITFSPALVTGDVVDYIVDMGRAVTIGQYDSDLVVSGELEVTGDIIGDLRGATLFKGQAGEALSKGDVVYISGISGNTTVVSKADANDSAKMPAFGIVAADANLNASVTVYTFGRLSGLDTSSYSEGDELFVSTTAGTLTNSAPTGESSKLQKIAKVTRSDNSAGSIFIMGAGRSNAVPNLDDGDIFIGNASNQAVSASLNTKIEDYLDAGTSTPAFLTLDAGNTTLTGYLRGPSTFTIDPATHGDDTGTLVVAGNLQVDGTTTTINSTTMTVDDLNITLASGAANAAAANGAGITVDGASATLTYNSTPDAWSFNKNVGIGTSSPDYTLVVQGDNNVNDNIFAVKDSDGTRMMSVEQTSNGDGRIFTFDTSGTAQVLLHSNGNSYFNGGNVGIGTSAPLRELQIGDHSGSQQALSIQASTTGKSDIFLGDGTGSGEYAGLIRYDHASDFMALWTSSTERMRIDSSGEVLSATAGSWRLRPDANSELAPAYAFNGDGNTGVYSPSSDTLGFSTQGTEKVRIDSSGNVGINEDSPQTLLHITDNSNGAKLRLQGNGSNGADSLLGSLQYFNNDGSNDTPAVVSSINSFSALSNGTGGYLTFATHDGTEGGEGSSAVERMRIDSAGNVLVGKNSSLSTNSRFEVATTNTTTTVNSGAGAALSIQNLSTTNNTYSTLYFTNGGGGVDSAIYGIHEVGNGTGSGRTGSLVFATAALGAGVAEKMRIDSSGNVGIGITSLVNPLQVSVTPNTASKTSGSAFDGGAVRLDGNLGSADSEVGILGGSNDGLSSGIGFARQDGSTWGTQLRFYTHSTAITTTDELTERMRLDASGNLGIGTTTPDGKLHIANGTYVDNVDGPNELVITSTNTTGGGIRLTNASSKNWFMYHGGSSSWVGDGGLGFVYSDGTNAATGPKVTFLPSGNVGIGTTSPAGILDVNGTLVLSGDTEHLLEKRITSAITSLTVETTELRGRNVDLMAYDDVNIRAGTGDKITLHAGGSERVRIDSSGRLLIGTSSSRETSGGGRQLQIEGTNGVTSSQSIVRNQNSTNGPSLTLGKSRSASVGGSTAVVDGDTLGQVTFAGADGTDLNTVGASIKSNVDGTPASNVMPANLIFSVNSGTSAEAEAMIISSNGQLKIGGTTNSPANVQAVLFGTGNASLIYNTGHTGLHINNENATAGFDNYGAGISFGRLASNSDDQSAAIVPVQTTADEDHMGIAFLTHDTNTRANPLEEKMRLDADGNLGLGTTDPSRLLHLKAADSCLLQLQVENTTGNCQVLFGDSGSTTVGKVLYNHTGNYMSFEANSAERMRILSSGGITFNGDTAAANALDDYEEGTWTPVYSRINSNPSVTYSSQTGAYTKIGNLVYASFDCEASSISGGSGNARISGLPFTASSSNNTFAGYSVAQWRDCGAISAGGSQDQLKGFVQRNNTYIYIQIDNSGSNGFGTVSTTVGYQSSGRMTGYIMYVAA